MKQEIKYKASKEVIELITRWQTWLRDERRYSAHTLDAYSRDLSCFFEFMQGYLDRTPTLADLQKAEIRLFRAFLSSRAARHIEKSSIARELSTLKNFYHWLARNNIIENPALEVISSPRRAKVLPRAVDVDDAFNILDIAKDFSKKEWQGLRDVAIFTILYGCGLRISEALSLNLDDINHNDFLKIKGKGGLHLTGNLGDVMKESAKIAYSHIKSLIDSKELKIDKTLIPLTRKEQEENIQVDCSEIYNRFDIHLHVPEGATPKDGPSAGIAIGSAIASLFSNRPIKSSFAMTGELTLRGKVLPIGGLQEKLIAAFKSGIKEVLIPKKNFERDMDEIPDEVKENIKIHPVEDFREVLKYILETK